MRISFILPACMFAALVLYFLVMGVIGVVAGRRVTTMEDYLVANRRLPFSLALPTLVATWFGAGSCLSVSGTVYKEGFYGVLPDPFGCSLGLLLAGLLLAAPFRRRKLLTISDLLAQAYGPAFERVATLVTIPFYVGTLASQMVAMGYVFQLVFGGDATTGMFIGTALVAFYTITGGMWAVTVTDFVQLALLCLGLLVILPLCFTQVPDHAALWSAFGREWSHLSPQSGWLSFLGRLLMTGLGALMGQDLIQRSLASKSESVARSSAIVGGFVYFLLGLIPLFVGVAGRFIYPVLEKPEHLMLLLAKDFLSPLAFALFACGLLAAIMSTADSYLLAGTSLLTHNVLLKLRPTASEPTKIRLARLVNLGLTLLALSLALRGHSIFDLMVHSGAMLFVALLVPALAALLWRRATPRAAWASLTAGIAAWALALFLPAPSTEELLFSAALLGGLASLVTYLLATFLPVPRREQAIP